MDKMSLTAEKIALHHNITSLQKLNFKGNAGQIWMKRDDTLDFAFGGNKVRLYEYILPEIVRGGYCKITSFGSIYSNHNRVTAAVAAYLGIECDLIVFYNGYETDLGSNGILIQNYFGANILYCRTENAHDFIEKYQSAQIKSGIHYYWVPGGGHIGAAVNGYIDAMNETICQANKMGIHFDAVFLPTGTGTTQAGVIYAMDNINCDVYGITVVRTPEKCKTEIINLLKEFDSSFVGKKEIRVLNHIKAGYGVYDSKLQDIAKKLATSDGIILDPIYNSKGFAGMLEELKYHDYHNVLYINTGGSPNIFNG